MILNIRVKEASPYFKTQIMLAVIRILAVVIFAAWFILTVLVHFKFSWKDKLVALSAGLLPQWNFFAPNPGTYDFHLVYRVKSSNGISAFREVPLHHREYLISAFWNSEKRLKKVLFDLVIDLAASTAAMGSGKGAIKTSFSYIALLNFLTGVPKGPDAESIQFAIMSSTGFLEFEKPTMILCSAFHHL